MTEMRDRFDPKTVMLAILTALAIIAALKIARPVAVPIAFTAFLIGATWPVRDWLARKLPERLSTAATILTLCLALIALIAGAALLVRYVLAQSESAAGAFQQQWQTVSSWLQSHGLPKPAQAISSNDVTAMARRAARIFYGVLGGIGIVLALYILTLPGVPGLAARIQAVTSRDAGKQTHNILSLIARRLQRYLGSLLIISALTGVAVTAFCMAVGLNYAVLWGVVAFFLNFIAVIGSLIAILFPVLMAVIQFDGWTMPLVVLGGVGGIQLLIDNFLFPKFVGDRVSLAAPVLLAAVMFWGFLWGIPGAILAAPLTVTAVIVLAHFQPTRWIAGLLATWEGDYPQDLPGGGKR